MTLLEALGAVFESNQRIRRRLWSSRIVVGLENNALCIKGYSSTGPDDGLWHPWTVTESDYFSDDWEVVE